ncbi:MAG: pilus assembly protein PilM [Verrucomicrobia bacterium]|nr:pilus assembly protein PilM [Verrucomicrobiota bacterium]
MNGFPPSFGRHQIAIDPGTRRIKLLATEASKRGVRVLRPLTIDLREEGLLTEEEIRHQVEAAVAELGDHPIALAIPQPVAISQVVDLPAIAEMDIKKFIEGETVSLSGLSESLVLYDFCRLRPFGRFQNPCWLTISREENVQQQFSRLTASETEVKEVTTTANALIAAYRSLQPEQDDLVLVDLGAGRTVVAVIQAGQGVFAASFPKGSDAFTEAIMAAKACPLDEAEGLKRAHNFFAEPAQPPGMCAAVDGWFRELEKILQEWWQANPDLAASFRPCRLLLSGGGVGQPGLLEHLAAKPGFEVATWSQRFDLQVDWPVDDYAVAYGVAVEAAQQSPQHTSLLPARLKTNRQRLQRMLLVNSVGLVVLLLTALLLAVGFWQKLSLVLEKRDLTQQAELTLKQARQIEMLARRRDAEFERLAPLLQRQRQTVEALRTLHVVQQSRTQKEFWYVLLADQQSYFRGAAGAAFSTNVPADTNLFLQVTNVPAKPGFIAELCIPAESDKALKTLSDLVAELKKEPLFSNVDSLAANQRKNLVDPKVLVPDRHFSLFIEVKESEWQPPAALGKAPEPRATTNGVRKPAVGPKPKPDRSTVAPAESPAKPSA